MKIVKLTLAALLIAGTLAPMVSTEAMAYCRACRRTICCFR